MNPTSALACRLSGNRCQCAACGECFNRVSTFDRHRVGEQSARRCITPDEMEAKGWRRNGSGFWITKPGGWRK